MSTMPEPVVTIAEMCSRLAISRSNFFWHIQKGTFHRPHKLANGRSFFKANQAAENEAVKKSGIGINGVLFYERKRPRSTVSSKGSKRYGEVIDLLSELGISGLTATQIEEAISVSFTKKPEDLTSSSVLRTIFKYLSNPKDV